MDQRSHVSSWHGRDPRSSDFATEFEMQKTPLNQVVRIGSIEPHPTTG